MRASSLLWVLLCLANFPAHAQSLHDFLQAAAGQNPQVTAKKLQRQAALLDLEAAEWARYPSLSAEVRTERQSGAQSQARIEQPVWTAGRLTSQIERAKSQAEVANWSALELQQEILAQTVGAFFDTLRLQDRLQTADENVSEHERLLQLIERRAGTEISPQADVVLAQARLQQAITDRLQLAKQLHAVRFSLTELAGMPISGKLRAPANLPVSRYPDATAILAAAIDFSPQMKRFQGEIDVAEQNVALARSKYFPSLVAGYQYDINGTNNDNLDRGRWFLALQYQTGSGLSNMSQVQAALASQQAAFENRAAFQRQLESKTATLDEEVRSLELQQKPARALLESTGEVVDSYLRQYQIGRKNWLDVLNVQREKTQARYGLTDVEHNLASSRLKLMLLTGDLNPDTLPQLHD